MVPTILYASESWPIQKKQEDKLIAAEMKHLRRITGKTKFDRIRNVQIREELHQKPINKQLETKQLKWFGHIQRMSEERLVKKVIQARRVEKRRVGRPKKNWVSRIEEVGRERGKTMEEMKIAANNRKEWRKWVESTSDAQ